MVSKKDLRIKELEEELKKYKDMIEIVSAIMWFNGETKITVSQQVLERYSLYVAAYGEEMAKHEERR